MGAEVAIIASAALPAPSREQWMEDLRSLARDRRHIDWQLADCLAIGVEQGYIEQTGFDFLAGELGIAPRRLKEAVKAAASVPAAGRDEALSVQHHAMVATLPSEEADALLTTARDQHWTPERTRIEAVRRRAEIGQGCVFSDDDWEQHELAAIARAWNRARASVRAEFLEMAKEADGKVIDV